MKRILIALSLVTTVACTAQAQDAKQPAPAQPAPSAPAQPSVAGQADTAALPVAIAGTSAKLVRFELAQGITDKEPTGTGSEFSRASTPRVFAFFELNNKGGEPFELEVRFESLESAGSGRNGVKLAIPSAPRWRTQALSATRKPGKYRAVLVAPDGSEVATREFTVVE